MAEDTKNFDDTELDDIMREIEELEDDTTVEAVATTEIEGELSEEEYSDIDALVDKELEELNGISEVSGPEVESDEAFSQTIDEVENEITEEVNNTHLDEEADADVDEILEELDHKQEVAMSKSNVTSIKPVETGSTTPCKMEFNIAGEMEMGMVFTINGEAIHLSVSGNGLEIEMDHGARFSLPVGKKAA